MSNTDPLFVIVRVSLIGLKTANSIIQPIS